jgi:hypothetical protein
MLIGSNPEANGYQIGECCNNTDQDHLDKEPGIVPIVPNELWKSTV